MKQAIRQNRLLVTLTVLLSVVGSAATVGIAMILQRVIDAALAGDMEQFRRILVYSLLYLLALALISYLGLLSGKKLIRNLTIDLRGGIFRGIFARSLAEYRTVNSADYLSALSYDIKQVEDNYLQPWLAVLQNGVTFLASLVALLVLSPLVTGVLLGSMLLMFAVPTLFGKALQSRQSAVSEQMALFTASLKDFLSGFEVIKSFALGKRSTDRFRETNKAAAGARFAADRLLAQSESLSQLLAILSQFGVIFLAAYLILTGRMTAGTLVALVQLSGGLVGPVLAMMQSLPKIKGVRPVISRLDALAAVRTDSGRPALSPTFANQVDIRELSFGYKEGQTVLNGVSLTLEKGKKYALVGRSGCGKSTLAKLLTGTYEEYEGSIAYDGLDIRQLDSDLLVQLSATIHQQVYLFDADIRQNVCLYEDFPQQALEEAIQASGMTGFLSGLQDGLGSPVGENGCNLSGGERQRVAVARSLIRSKPLLILDEGTSAVDRQTAYEIESRLLTLPELTLVTITHNMGKELLSLYDEIIYMEQGRIVEKGKLEELLAVNSGFARFVATPA